MDKTNQSGFTRASKAANFTVIMAGWDGGAGIGLVEIYNLR
jgi:hypothetical protein